MNGTSLTRQQISPGFALGVGQAPPDKVVDLMSHDVNEVGCMAEEVGIENDFAARNEARREDFVTRPGAICQLAAIGTHLLGEADG